MKVKNPIILTALLIGCLSTHAATYYVSSISGNDSYTSTQAQSQATPWKTLAKVNSFFNSLNPGDQVLLQDGSVFSGQLIITKSGTAAQPIVISTYGSGAAPVISGFANIIGWTSIGSNIWQSVACAACGLTMNMVEIADTSQYMGRYPNVTAANGGYLQIQSYNGTSSITDSHLSGQNWTGSQLVLRKSRWVIETDPIVSQTGTTINYTTSSTYTPAVKYGYFIQNSPSTLDVNGEWYYNPSTKKMNLYSTTNPSAFATPVQGSMIDTLVKASNQSYIHINGISFTGANKTAMSFYYCNFITVTNCSISFSGLDGIDGIYTNYMYLEYDHLNYTNNNGITVNGTGNMVEYCSIANTATFPGRGGQPANAYLGIWAQGTNNTIQYNSVTHTGYSGISFSGTNTNVLHNYVNKFCFVKDDGGGIYTWNGNTDSTNKHLTGYITGNIVDSGMACPAGTDSAVPGIAHGIYLDENTTECYVTGNTVVHSTAGVFWQDSRNCTIQNNTLYDNIGAMVIRHALPTGSFAGNDVSYNIAVTNVDTENAVIPSSITTSSGLLSFGYLHNNYYAMVQPGTYFYHLSFTDVYGPGSYGSWQSPYGEDVVYSNILNLNFTPYTINSLIGSNLYTKGTISTQFSSAAAGSRVVVGTATGALTKGTWYVVNFSMTAPDAAHTMLVFLEQVTTPYPEESPVISVPMVKGTANYSVAFQATGSTANGGLVFQIANTEAGISVSNITLYQANVTVNNADQNVIFKYNATNSSVSLGLSGTYQDATGATHSGSVTIPAYGSILLFKKS
jgi:parallel beta-helix repeat protein